MFAYHKEFWPLSTSDWLSFSFAAVTLMIAAGGGIGGGGVLVPLYMLFLGFRPKHAIALSNFTILGGAIANTLFNVQKTDVVGGSLIDWDIIVMMEPSTIAGAVVGSFASKYLPDFVVTVALAIVLAMLSHRTLQKGVNMYNKESAEEASRARLDGAFSAGGPPKPPPEDLREAEGLLSGRVNWGAAELGGPGSSAECRDHSSLATASAMAPLKGDGTDLSGAAPPWDKIRLLIICFGGCVVLTVMKGSGHGSIVGVECGSTAFWVLGLACVPWVVVFAIIFRSMLVSENQDKAGRNHGPSNVIWDATTTIKYPLFCTTAGVFAGLFGVGGGIVKGPLMLEMGVNPLVAAATAATMILFTTSAACVSFEIFGLLEPKYAMACFFLGLICTAIGQGAINAWMRSAKRQSPPVLSIGAVMALSTALVAIEAVAKAWRHSADELFHPSSICSRSE